MGATTRTCPSGWPTSQATTAPRWLSWAGSSEVSHGPKFPAARGNRRDFPETKEEKKEEEEADDSMT